MTSRFSWQLTGRKRVGEVWGGFAILQSFFANVVTSIGGRSWRGRNDRILHGRCCLRLYLRLHYWMAPLPQNCSIKPKTNRLFDRWQNRRRLECSARSLEESWWNFSMASTHTTD